MGILDQSTVRALACDTSARIGPAFVRVPGKPFVRLWLLRLLVWPDLGGDGLESLPFASGGCHRPACHRRRPVPSGQASASGGRLVPVPGGPKGPSGFLATRRLYSPAEAWLSWRHCARFRSGPTPGRPLTSTFGLPVAPKGFPVGFPMLLRATPWVRSVKIFLSNQSFRSDL